MTPLNPFGDFIMTVKEELLEEAELSPEKEKVMLDLMRRMGDQMDERIKENNLKLLGITMNHEEPDRMATEAELDHLFGRKKTIDPYADVEGFGEF